MTATTTASNYFKIRTDSLQEVRKEPASQPAAHLLELQASWLEAARSRLLRRAAIARRRRVLDLGAGYGAVTAELTRRCAGLVVALDCVLSSLHENPYFEDAFRVGGSAFRLPFADASFDLVFSQCALLWMVPIQRAVEEIHRVLEPGGAMVAIEPDYGAMIEFPEDVATKRIWMDALRRAGADPLVGRILPVLLESSGLRVRVDLLDQITPPALERFEFLYGLPLSMAEQQEVRQIEKRAAHLSGWELIVHLPFFLVTAVKQGPAQRRKPGK